MIPTVKRVAVFNRLLQPESALFQYPDRALITAQNPGVQALIIAFIESVPAHGCQRLAGHAFPLGCRTDGIADFSMLARHRLAGDADFPQRLRMVEPIVDNPGFWGKGLFFPRFKTSLKQGLNFGTLRHV
ncbi:hypothetical protein SCU88_12755 [Jejubacter sp. L23]